MTQRRNFWRVLCQHLIQQIGWALDAPNDLDRRRILRSLLEFAKAAIEDHKKGRAK